MQLLCRIAYQCVNAYQPAHIHVMSLDHLQQKYINKKLKTQRQEETQFFAA